MMTQVQENKRGIPNAPFVAKVSDFVSDNDYATTLQKFNEMLQKFKFMQGHLEGRLTSLDSKIPELAKSLEALLHLSKQTKTSKVDFEVADTLYASALVEPPENVNLWLGANVMLQYPTKEAIDLLTEKLGLAKISKAEVEEDLEFLRIQITVMEVNIARVYNAEVKYRRELKA